MSFEFHINGNQTTFFILFVLRSCTFGFADYTRGRPFSFNTKYGLVYIYLNNFRISDIG